MESTSPEAVPRSESCNKKETAAVDVAAIIALQDQATRLIRSIQESATAATEKSTLAQAGMTESQQKVTEAQNRFESDATQAIIAVKKRAESASAEAAKCTELLAQIVNAQQKSAESQAKADNEALRAFQAKQMVEEHSSSVSKLKGTVEADTAAIAKTKNDCELSAKKVFDLRSQCETDVALSGNARKAAEEASKTASALVPQIKAFYESVETLKKQSDTEAQKVSKNATTADVSLSKIEASKSAADNLLAELRSAQTAVNTVLAEANGLLREINSRQESAESTVNTVSTLVEQMTKTEQSVNDYESNLKRLVNDYEIVKTRVEGLLPGAASASLASAFRVQKDRFKRPQRMWMALFITSIVGLLGLALWGLFQGGGLLENWDSILRMLVHRLPFVIPLVWIGLYAGHQYMLALRMEEEYAFKEAVSTAFEGYKREMQGISGADGATKEPPINVLCGHILTSLARRPGVIYEGKQDDVTPLSCVSDAVAKVAPTVLSNPIAASIKAG